MVRESLRKLNFCDVTKTAQEVLLLVFFLLVSGPVETGSDVTSQKVKLRGAGASFPTAVYNEWMSAYQEKRKHFINLEMTYKSVGSTSGRNAIMGQNNLVVEYGASDYALTEQQKKDYPDLKLLPTMAG